MPDSEFYTLLSRCGALLDGHFLLTSGRHSSRYIEKFRLLEDPVSLDEVATRMVQDIAPATVDIVLGAAVGGILLVGAVSRHLARKSIFTERVDGKMTLRRGFQLHRGARVLIVEDIVTTGGSVFELIEIVRKHAAEIVLVTYLVDRNEQPVDFGVPSRPMLHLPTPSWKPDECPLCAENMPLTQRGRSGKG